MKNNLKKITYILIVLFFLIFSLINVYALTESELQAQKNTLDEQINQTNTEIAGLKSQMSESLDMINRLNIQISEYEQEIEVTESNLENTEKILAQKRKELAKAQEKYDEQKEMLEKRLIAMYESSQTTYLDLLLGSKDLSDFISKYYLVKELAEYDQEVIDSLELSKLVVEKEESEIAKESEELETTMERLTAQRNSMEILIKDKANLISNLTEEEKILEQKLAEYEEDKKQIESELAKIAKQNAIKASVTPSSCGYISPLTGLTRKNITTGYYGYSGHTGVDFAISAGTEIKAVKSGTVVISEAKKNSAGYYRSYGEYIVIDHHDGTMTLYAHGLPDSRKVISGDEVEAGQTIMLVGSTRKFNRASFTF